MRDQFNLRGRVSNAARVFTTHRRPMFTTASRPDFTRQSDQRWLQQVRVAVSRNQLTVSAGETEGSPETSLRRLSWR